MSKANFSIVITGEWPGVGQSTTAKLLAQELGFERVYAGLLQRHFAYIWDKLKSKISWNEFVDRFHTNTIKLSDFPFSEKDFNEDVNVQWSNQLKSVGIPEMWDKIIDQQSLNALKRPGTVVEGKVGVMIDKIGLGTFKDVNHKICKILLICPPEISTHRIIKRKMENHELQPMDTDSQQYQALVQKTTSGIIKRHLKDWERYEKIYSIKRSDIYKSDIFQVFTTNKEPQEVITTILEHIHSQ
jgi:cytidylate kinase